VRRRPSAAAPAPDDRAGAPFDAALVRRHADHCPWPPPARPWAMTQRWLDLLFAHWPVAADLETAFLELTKDEGLAP